MDAERQWNNIFKLLKGKTNKQQKNTKKPCQARIPYQKEKEKKIFKYES